MLGHKGVAMGPDTAYAKELRLHEATHTQYGPPGRPYVFREYPKRVYKAVKGDNGGIVYDGKDVGNDLEERNMLSRGYHFGQNAALEAYEQAHTEAGILAAERNFEIRHNRISERAAVEVRAAEEAHGASHLPEVPVTPIRRRGPNKPKVQ